MSAVVVPMGHKGRGPKGGRKGDDRRAVVRVHTGRVNETTDAAEEGLRELGVYFSRGDLLVRLSRVADEPSAGDVTRPAGLPVFVAASAAGLQDDFERACRFVSMLDAVREDKVIGCPKAVPAVYLSRVARWRMPWARGLAHVPVLQPDGSVMCEGYDAARRVVVCAGDGWEAASGPVSDADAQATLGRLKDLLGGFPFVDATDLSVTVTAMLTAVMRPMLQAAPAFGWSATSAGSGKSKLADICAILATGRRASALAWPAAEEEGEKRLGAMLLGGDAVVCIDNVERPLRGDLLNSLLTQDTVGVRILGTSTVPKIECCQLLLSTGNNLEIAGDLTRRFLVARLDPQMERPELREFSFDPVERALEQRREIVCGLLRIARWRQQKGCDVYTPLGSFEHWSRVVRDAVVLLGLPDPCLSMEHLHAEDPERIKATDLLRAWQGQFGTRRHSTAECIRWATSTSAEALRDALDAVAGGPGGLSPQRVGRYLQRISGRVFGGMVLHREIDKATNAATWALKPAAVRSAT